MRYRIALAAAAIIIGAIPHKAQAQLTTAISQPNELGSPITELTADYGTSGGTLASLNRQQHYELGQQQACRAYKPSATLFLAGVGSGYTVTCGAGIASTVALLRAQPSAKRLWVTAPNPARLTDADYYEGYQDVVRSKRKTVLLAGIDTGVVAVSATLIAILGSSLGSL